jgi:hypothetical protein
MFAKWMLARGGCTPASGPIVTLSALARTAGVVISGHPAISTWALRAETPASTGSRRSTLRLAGDSPVNRSGLAARLSFSLAASRASTLRLVASFAVRAVASRRASTRSGASSLPNCPQRNWRKRHGTCDTRAWTHQVEAVVAIHEHGRNKWRLWVCPASSRRPSARAGLLRGCRYRARVASAHDESLREKQFEWPVGLFPEFGVLGGSWPLRRATHSGRSAPAQSSFGRRRVPYHEPSHHATMESRHVRLRTDRDGNDLHTGTIGPPSVCGAARGKCYGPRRLTKSLAEIAIPL